MEKNMVNPIEEQFTEPIEKPMVEQNAKPIVEQDAKPMVKQSEEPIEKTFTQEQVNQIIKKRLEKEKEKFREELEAEKNEAERLAKMSASEREIELLKKDREKFELEKQQFARERMLMETNKQMIQRNLPTDFAEYLLSDSAEKTLDNINQFQKTWDMAINNAVNAKLAGTSPTLPEKDNKQATYSIDEIKNMSTEQIMANFDSIQNALKNNK